MLHTMLQTLNLHVPEGFRIKEHARETIILDRSFGNDDWHTIHYEPVIRQSG